MYHQVLNCKKLFIDNDKVCVYLMKLPDKNELRSILKYKFVLDKEEMNKFHLFKMENKRLEFLLGRIVMKGILAKLYNKSVKEIGFLKDNYGKLFLDENIYNPFVNFNLSHTEGMIVCCIDHQGSIGIDIEKTDKDYLEMMDLVFTSEEITHVKLNHTYFEKKSAFYKIWTRKEAFMKMIGKGFSLDPLKFEVPLKNNLSLQEGILFDSFNHGNFIISLAVRCNKVKEIEYFDIPFQGIDEILL
ncbi:4'-phosphopantetheinyl transferase superfamily protein [Sutcliffiella horikoshii]|uniref:4'-phosphopantetheinyl transferase superfamily protein n=1 Tax=Sutcliffiella horikoshii TaxID=79883 RepID=A0A5D4T5Q8_9BACI|nr:4'-phosphopantetheinyl transferase superfamily protein [Sutcliffiella horikoshii]TYS71050.1 4'-phosphopantetheinyl transferase superfamily protein [Sutcliffiella horikoshii]